MGRVYIGMAHGIGLGSMFLKHLAFLIQMVFFLMGAGTKNYYFNHFGVENDAEGDAAAGHTLLFSAHQVTHG